MSARDEAIEAGAAACTTGLPMEAGNLGSPLDLATAVLDAAHAAGHILWADELIRMNTSCNVLVEQDGEVIEVPVFRRVS